MSETIEGHGGDLALAALARFGVDVIFTLSGGHVFPFYDAAVKRSVRLLDVRHEQSAAFGAEAMAKLTRRPGVAVVTAGPGVTNAISAMTTAHFNGSPLVVLGGRASQGTWGTGTLQEFDHVPVVAPLTKLAGTVFAVNDIAAAVHHATVTALTPHRGPVFLDFPMDVVYAHGSAPVPDGPARGDRVEPDPADISQAAELIAAAEHPVIIAGSDVWWAGAEEALRDAAESLVVPVFTNGMGRGCLAADHRLAFTRTRGRATKEADVVVVIGAPLDFRLSYGSFGAAAVVHIVDAPDGRASHVKPAVSPAGDLGTILRGLAEWTGPRRDHEPWVAHLAGLEQQTWAADEPALSAASDPVKPARVYGELRRRLDRDAVVICDGGDFASYAGKYIDCYTPGCWLDTGPYGCLGTGMGYAAAARLVHPDRQIVVLLGDGAAGFSLMDADTLVRHGLPVVMVIGNNGIWGLEKHPMQAIYGYDVVADLQPECRYDEVVRALGGAGEIVTDPEQVGPAMDRGFAAGVPYVVNVATDPADVYPRVSRVV